MLFHDLPLCSLVFALCCDTKAGQVALGVFKSWCQQRHVWQDWGSLLFSFAFIVSWEPFAKGNITLRAAKFADLVHAAVNSEL